MGRKKFGINGSSLKILALITMMIDHAGAVIVLRFLSMPEFDYDFWYGLYQPMRMIGRIAFPIYCFLLVEGFLRTGNRKKYLGRMFLFALLSEIPFNLAITGQIFHSGYQNVFFELTLAILMMLLLSTAEKAIHNTVMGKITSIFVIGSCMVLGEILNFDYGYYGILSIAALYIFRYDRRKQMLIGAVSFLWEWPAMFAFLPMTFYNGKRGRQMKYLFYTAYPLHLLVFYLITVFFGCPV